MEAFEKDRIMAQKLALAVERAGGVAYYVGGCVRDRLRGAATKDLDVEVHGLTPAQLEEILDTLGQRIAVGESFGIYGLKGYSLDIAMPRKEENRGKGHRDFEVFVDPFIGTRKAAERRDFTVNAIMEEVLSGRIVDEFNGRRDLEQGILRHVNDQTFAEDPLRVLRGAQFAARFGFRLAPETAEIFKKMSLEALPRERILGELEKALLKADRPSVFFEILRKTGQLELWFPELMALIGVEQNPKHHPEGDVWNHTMLVLDQAARLRDRAANPLGLMLAALCHDFGKAVATETVKGVIHAYGHEVKGLPLVRTFMKRLTNETELIRYVLNLTEFHMKPNVLAGAGASVRSTNKLFDRSVDPDGLLALAAADKRGKTFFEERLEEETFLTERLALYRDYMSRPYVMGKDLIEAGLKPCPEFSDYLAYAHKLRLAGVEKAEALKQTLGHARAMKKKTGESQ